MKAMILIKKPLGSNSINRFRHKFGSIGECSFNAFSSNRDKIFMVHLQNHVFRINLIQF
jgi:hypothetical protein